MHYDTLPESDHPHVLLRLIAEADLPRWFAYLSTPAVYLHTSWNVTGPEQLAPFVWRPETATASSVLRLAVASRDSGEMLGSVGFHSISPEHRTAELAYDYAPEAWGRGIATHIARQCVAWAHERAGFLRVQATVLVSNAGSKAVLERCGFEHEGLLRSYKLVRGVPGDFHLYAHVVPPGAAGNAPP